MYEFHHHFGNLIILHFQIVFRNVQFIQKPNSEQ